MKLLKLTRLMVIASALLIWTNARAATFTVTTTNDLIAADGVLSLREAISNANVTAASDLIDFNIAPLNGTVKTITPTSSLPSLDESVTIDGYTQDTAQPNTLTNDNNAVLLIELNGSATGGSGLNITVSNTVVRGLVINGFASNGISVNGSPVRDVVIEGNFIGTDPTGTAKDPNAHGIFAGGPDLTIGGTTPGARNLISGNSLNGISTGGLGVTNIVVQGNFIGTDVHGTAPLGNGNVGIFIGTTPSNTVGGVSIGAGNVIAGNGGVGINITTSANLVEGNWIGTDMTGTLNLSNHNEGVIIGSGGKDNQIGGAVGNFIAFNGDDGVLIQPTIPFASNNLVSANAIFDNGALGINLGSFSDPASGVTSNDVGDVDDGSNHQQNFPVLTAATNITDAIQITGFLNSTPNTVFTLEFFANTSCDPSGFGEGEFFIGATNVTTAANGTNNFTATFGVSIDAGLFITATATDPNQNTSEFSSCVPSQGGTGTVTLACSLAPSLDTNTVGAAHTVTSTITTNGNAASGVTVNFAVISGPNNGDNGSDVTDSAGQATFQFTGNSGPGTDTIRAIGAVAGQISTCTATKVWIAATSSNLPPNAICQNVTNSAAANCQAVITASQVDNGSTDADGTITNRTLSPAGPYALGNTVVMLTVTDDDGDSDSCSATIVVRDTTLPTVTCPGTIITNVPNEVSQAVVTFQSTFSDNCSLVTSNCTPASGTTFGLGTNSVTCLAVDGSGNTNSCSFNVIVQHGPSVPHDLAIIKLKAPKNINLQAAAPALTKFASVTIQNLSNHPETITSYSNLVSLVGESLGTNCPNATVVVHDGPPNKALPLVLAPKKKLTIRFDVTYDCANDPLKGVGHADYQFTATVNHAALDGQADTVPANNVCPRAPSGSDKGCGGKGGASVNTDVFIK